MLARSMATMYKLPQTFGFILLVVSCFLTSTNAQVKYRYEYCYDNEGTFGFVDNANYGTNRDQALSHLPSLASTSYFNTYTAGLGQGQVNALFLCRYDVSPQVCQECVTQASSQAKTSCFLNVEGFIVYDECILHYANRTIFKTMEDIPIVYVYSYDKADDNGLFNQVVDSAVTGLIDNVISGFPSSSRYFATTKANYKAQTISFLAQCTPDITTSGCRGCLQSSFGNFTANYTGSLMGEVFTPSCFITYQLSSFKETPSPWFPSTDEGAGSLVYGSIMASIFIVTLSLILLI